MAMRLIAALLLCFNGALVHAEVTCEQLGEMAHATVQLRDQGEPLAAVLAEADRVAASGRFTPEDVALMKAVIQASFRRDRSPHEILYECREQRSR
jgi:hypothetical protein